MHLTFNVYRGVVAVQFLHSWMWLKLQKHHPHSIAPINLHAASRILLTHMVCPATGRLTQVSKWIWYMSPFYS